MLDLASSHDPTDRKGAAFNGESLNGEGAPSVVFVLMAGGFRPPPVSVAAGCVVLDLHLTAEQTVLDRWHQAVSTLRRAGVLSRQLCLCGGLSTQPHDRSGNLEMIADQSDYRGPAGSLADACREFSPETTIIAAEAARYCSIDLGVVLAHHVKSGADVTVTCNPDMTPGGVYVLSRRMLDVVPPLGFMDLKEQWLNKLIDQQARVKVFELAEPGTMLLHSREDFLAAMRVCNEIPDITGGVGLAPRVLRHERQAASVICPEAHVAPDAIVVESLISPGAKVGSDTLVARSIVGPGTTLQAGASVIDAVAGPTGIIRSQRAGLEGTTR